MFIESFKSWTSCIVFISDSETAFCLFETSFLMICFCFVIIVNLSVCLFNLIYLIVCLRGVITRSYHSFLIKKQCNMIVCLLPKLSHDKSLRMRVAIIRGLVILFP